MQKYDNYETTEAFTGDFEQLELGGHVCRIMKVECANKDYGQLLTIEFDIADGKQKGFFQKRYKESLDKSITNAKWPNAGKYYQTVKKDDLRFFKGFMQCIEKSNDGFKFDWDEKKLEGKVFGGVFGQEEWINGSGEIKLTTKCQKVVPVEVILKGVEIPPIKRVKESDKPAIGVVFDDTSDCPFM